MVSNEMTSTHGQLLEITCPGLSSWLCCSHVTSRISTTLNDRIITHVLIKSGALCLKLFVFFRPEIQTDQFQCDSFQSSY